MVCPKCGSEFPKGTKFCASCGSDVSNVVEEAKVETKTTKTQEKVGFVDYFKIILGVVAKPVTTFENDVKKFTNFKDAGIVAGMIALIATFIRIISAVLGAVVTSSWTGELGIHFENIARLNFVRLVLANLLIYAAIIALIAGVFYLAGLVAKKETNFSKLLVVSATSIVPMLIVSLIISPLLSMLFAPLGTIVTLAATVYTFILIYEGMDHEFNLKGNKRVYFSLIAMAISYVAIHYISTYLIYRGELASILDYLPW